MQNFSDSTVNENSSVLPVEGTEDTLTDENAENTEAMSKDDGLIDFVDMVNDHFVIKLPNGEYPLSVKQPMIPADQGKEDMRHREDISADVSDFGHYRVYASSIRGTGKRDMIHPGIRQDSYAVGSSGNRWIIGAVADGVSASSKAHMLADYMAQFTANRLTIKLEECSRISEIDWAEESKIIREAAYEYCRDYCQQHQLEGSYLKYFATTLEFIIVGMDEDNDGEYAYVSISGDGNGYIFNKEGLLEVIKSSDDSEGKKNSVHSEAVVALPREPGDPFVRYGVLNDGEYILIATDGYAKIGNKHMKIGEYLFDKLTKVNGIITYLQAMDFYAFQNDDDRTGIMIGRKTDAGRN